MRFFLKLFKFEFIFRQSINLKLYNHFLALQGMQVLLHWNVVANDAIHILANHLRYCERST